MEDQRHGKGTLKFTTGEKFSGTFYEDKAEGDGIFYLKNGGTVQSVWIDNVLTT